MILVSSHLMPLVVAMLVVSASGAGESAVQQALHSACMQGMHAAMGTVCLGFATSRLRLLHSFAFNNCKQKNKHHTNCRLCILQSTSIPPGATLLPAGNDLNCNQKELGPTPSKTVSYCRICGAGNFVPLIDSCSLNDQ
jgi:hypothetical protein